jgi:hypothetical protein
MIKLHSIAQIEHKEYAFENAKAETEVFNGDFGAITSGVFAPAASGVKAIVNIEVGDDEYLDKYPIDKGQDLRVVDLAKFNGETIEVYGKQLPATFKKGDKLVSDATGSLVVANGTSEAPTTAPYFEVTKVIGNKIGIEVTVVAE